jgi:hypothetical protein
VERAFSALIGASPLNGAAIIHHGGFGGLHEIPPVVRKRSEESSALRRLKANSIAGGFLLVRNRARLVNACADAIAGVRINAIYRNNIPLGQIHDPSYH